MSGSSGTSYALPWRVSGSQSQKAGSYSADDHPRVIFISTRVPAAQVGLYMNIEVAEATYSVYRL